jgi:hypothetical protein
LNPYYHEVVRLFNRAGNAAVIEMTKMEGEKRTAEYATIKGNISEGVSCAGIWSCRRAGAFLWRRVNQSSHIEYDISTLTRYLTFL